MNTTTGKTNEVLSGASAKAREVKDMAREQWDNVAETVREKSRAASDYLHDATIKSAARDFAEVVRRHPVQSIAIGLGVGYLFSRLFRRSHD
jgi:ElaB/YqjD/DUF883 family membrane-anchored ribosome-binding protein